VFESFVNAELPCVAPSFSKYQIKSSKNVILGSLLFVLLVHLLVYRRSSGELRYLCYFSPQILMQYTCIYAKCRVKAGGCFLRRFLPSELLYGGLVLSELSAWVQALESIDVSRIANTNLWQEKVDLRFQVRLERNGRLLESRSGDFEYRDRLPGPDRRCEQSQQHGSGIQSLGVAL
jgi:hypothetical protein